MTQPPALSVVVPTYRRPQPLLRLLSSLQGEGELIEVLVVDNAADPSLRELIGDFNTRHAVTARWIPERELGLHVARNTGARHASAPLVAFTDDDATVAPGWARAYVETFASHPALVAAGGPSVPAWESPPPDWLLRLVARRPAFFQLSIRDLGPALRLDEEESFWGVNMVVRRDALIAAGGFNPELVGTDCIGDGEGGLFRKLRAMGARIGYIPAALVHHHIDAHRMTLSYLRTRMRNEGRSEAYADLRAHRTHPVRALVRMLATSTAYAMAVSLVTLPLRASRATFPVRLQLLGAEHRGRAAFARRALRDVAFRRQALRDDWMQ